MRSVWLVALAAASIFCAVRVAGAPVLEPRAPVVRVPTSQNASGSAKVQPKVSGNSGLIIMTWLAQGGTITVPAAFSPLDWPLGILWACASLVCALALLTSAKRLHGQRATGKVVALDGTPVHVFHDIGPALFGIARYNIVVPCGCASSSRQNGASSSCTSGSMRWPGDPVVLWVGALFSMLQPWNRAVWFMVRRLRSAVEADATLAFSHEAAMWAPMLSCCSA